MPLSDFAKWLLWISSFGQAPDARARTRARHILSSRKRLGKAEWYEQHWRHRGVPQELSDFVYEHFPYYSQIDFGSVAPSDRLVKDLDWFRLCWNDWEFDLYDEFRKHFGVRIEKSFELETDTTVEQMVLQLAKCFHGRGATARPDK